MTVTPHLGQALAFLEALAKNNERPWFEMHRKEYDEARQAFEGFVDGLIDEFRAEDGLQALKARECMARIHRDVRFSKDKSPYKTNMGALVGPGGWKGGAAGYYVSLEPGGKTMVAGGLYAPTPEQLERFRRHISQDAWEFRDIVADPDFTRIFGGVSGERLKTAPRGYDMSHPQIDLLQLKQITAIRQFSDGEALGADFHERVVEACRAMKPFLEFITSLG